MGLINRLRCFARICFDASRQGSHVPRPTPPSPTRVGPDLPTMDSRKAILHPTRPMRHLRILFVAAFLFVLVYLTQYDTSTSTFFFRGHRVRPPPDASAIIARCRRLHVQAGPPEDFHSRTHSDRFEEGITPPVLIKNAKIWTGRRNGTDVIRADILLDKGLIKRIGHLRGLAAQLQLEYGKRLVVVDAKGAWVTPGIVDIHSHLGDAASPALDGAEDDNSLKGTIQPWLRSLDGLNTHDDSYPLSIAGGVTTSLILPGSANAIGIQLVSFQRRLTNYQYL